MKKHLFKFLSIILAVMLVWSMTACGKSIGTGPAANVVEIESASEKTTEAKNSSSKDSSVETKAGEPKDEAGKQEPTGDSASVPTQASGETPTQAPVVIPAPEQVPTEAPTQAPTETPTQPPTEPPTEAPTQAPVPTWTISVSIDGGTYGGYFGGGTFTYYYQPTAYDALVSTGVGYTGSGYYISSINGLGEFDHGPMSGWLYAVNGVTPGVGCGSYYLNNGDSVSWFYQGDE